MVFDEIRHGPSGYNPTTEGHPAIHQHIVKNYGPREAERYWILWKEDREREGSSMANSYLLYLEHEKQEVGDIRRENLVGEFNPDPDAVEMIWGEE